MSSIWQKVTKKTPTHVIINGGNPNAFFPKLRIRQGCPLFPL
jgi:hypothetical protein